MDDPSLDHVLQSAVEAEEEGDGIAPLVIVVGPEAVIAKDPNETTMAAREDTEASIGHSMFFLRTKVLDSVLKS